MVNALPDVAQLLLRNISVFWLKQQQSFILSVILGLLVAGLCWLACVYHSRLWNLSYRVTLVQHVVCGLAATCTFFLVVLYSSLNCLQTSLHEIVELGKTQLEANLAWDKEVSRMENNAMHQLGTPAELERAGASVVVIQTNQYFSEHYPALAQFLDAKVKPDQNLDEVVAKAMFQGRVPLASVGTEAAYRNSKAIETTVSSIASRLDSKVAQFAELWRIRIAIILLICQLLAFVPISIAAYRDLKITT